MAPDEDDDLYDEEFDFVDDDEDEFDDGSDIDAETEVDVPAESGRSSNNRAPRAERDDRGGRDSDVEQEVDEEPVDEYGRPAPKADYVVHIYEHQKFKRTIDRPFTPEDAEAFATEYNRTGKPYGRLAVAGKNDVKPKKALV